MDEFDVICSLYPNWFIKYRLITNGNMVLVVFVAVTRADSLKIIVVVSSISEDDTDEAWKEFVAQLVMYDKDGT